VLYLSVAAGTPGTWIKISHNGVNTLSPPVRAYDSRTDSVNGKLQPGKGDTTTPRTIQITGAVAGIPSNAQGIVGNMAVTQGSSGFVTIWPSGAWPGTANINYQGADLSNAFTVGLSPTGSINLAASGSTHVVIDIGGYIL
jgi:hypothetical protein